MLISVVVPAYRAQRTIASSVESLIAQTWTDCEGIIVSDDGDDYAAVLRRHGLADERLHFVTTGRVGSGCHRARNVGLAAARGEFVVPLDADDCMSPRRLETLLPLAQSHGAAACNTRVVTSDGLHEVGRAFPDTVPTTVDIAGLLDLAVPLFPLVARGHAEPRIDGIEFGEDVVANLRLIDRLGGLPVVADGLYEYRVNPGSLCHGDNSADAFETSYSAMIDRIENGDRFALSAANAAIARERLIRKRDFNRAFAAARTIAPTLDFQTFAAAARADATGRSAS